VVLDQTPFYAEAGGQIGDTGKIQKEGTKVEIYNTKKSNDIIVHIGKVVEGEINTNENVTSVIDTERRSAIKRNHSATHLLHSVLRQVVGQHAEQSGSSVTPERLRFDFHHFDGVKEGEIARIEELMNGRVMENASVITDQMALDQARKAGATALFGEKYGANVRVVNIGDYSQELCGGTHVDNTGEIGLFKIISESSIAAGIRRIEAVTGNEAIALTRRKGQMLDRLCGVLDTQENTVIQRAEELMQQIKDLRKDVQKAKKDDVQKYSSDFISKAKEVSGVKIVTEVVKGVEIDDLRRTVDSLKKSLGSVAIILGTVDNGRATLIASLSNDLVKKGLHAGKIVGDIAKIVGGGGGGRADMAQAGGQLPDKIYEAIDLGFKILQKKIEGDM
jgi:alanyl-tRNA synthetase